MLFASTITTGFRVGIIGMPKSPAIPPQVSRHSHTRLFSSVLQYSSINSSRRHLLQLKHARQISTNSTSDITTEAIKSIAQSGDITPLTSELASAVTTHSPAVFHYGDLGTMGLTSWWPSGIFNWSLEIIHCTTSLPWFWTIIAGCTFWKIVTIPTAIAGMKSSARLLPLQDKINQVKERMDKAKTSGNRLEMQRAAVQMKTIHQKAGVKISHSLLPLIQMPVLLGSFFGLKALCNSGLEGLKHSGFSLLPDLTATTEWYYLPLIIAALANIQLSVVAPEQNSRPQMGHLLNAFRLVSVIAIGFMKAFPSGLLVALATTSGLTIVQSLILKVPRVREALKIPIPVATKRSEVPSPIATLRQYIVRPVMNIFQQKSTKKHIRKERPRPK